MQKKRASLFPHPKSVLDKIIYRLFSYYFHSRQGFLLGRFISLFQKKKKGKDSCHVACTKETKSKTERYNHKLHPFTIAAKLRDCFFFAILWTRAGVQLNSLFYLPFFSLRLLDQIWKWPDSVKKREEFAFVTWTSAPSMQYPWNCYKT